MTKIGKLFVVLCFALSLFILAWSIGFYFSRVKWEMLPAEKSAFQNATADKKRSLAATAGVIDRLQDRIQDLAFARDRVEYRYRQYAQMMADAETKRAQRLYWYQSKMKLARTGVDDKNQPVNDPIQALERDKDGIEIAVASLIGKSVISSRGVPLKSYDAFIKDLARNHGETERAQVATNAALVRFAQLTEDIQGLGSAEKPGLVRMKALQDDAKVRAIAEQEFLKPFLANRYGEAVLVMKRQQLLMDRKKELDSAGTAKIGK